MKRTRGITILAALILLAAAVTSAKAETRTITAEHTCVLGDNESKAQGRKICYLEAKRKILEKAGAIVVADTEVRDMQVARDVVRTYAAAKMRIKVKEEEFFVRAGNFAVRTVLTAEVDMRDFDSTLKMMRESPGDVSAARERALRTRRLEDRALVLREKIAAEEGPDAVAYLSEQQQIFRTLEEIEALSDAITADMRRTGRLARQYVKRGMTEGEVISMLGSPRAAKENDNMPSTWRCLNYGEVWVVFRNGLVECMREELRYEKRYGSDCHCAGFAGEVFTN